MKQLVALHMATLQWRGTEIKGRREQALKCARQQNHRRGPDWSNAELGTKFTERADWPLANPLSQTELAALRIGIVTDSSTWAVGALINLEIKI